MWACVKAFAWTVLVIVPLSSSGSGRAKQEVNTGQCTRDAAKCGPARSPSLIALSPVEVGHVEPFSLDSDEVLYRKTLSLKPALFEIAEFLTPAECEHLKEVSRAMGLESSSTRRNGFMDHVKVMDVNKDKLLDVGEMRITLEDSFDIYFDDADVHQMYKDLELDQNDDNVLTPTELGRVDVAVLEKWLLHYLTAHPTRRSRLSRQIWLTDRMRNDSIISAISRRVAKLTGLSEELMAHSDVQVVNYNVGGHYHAHCDSSNSSVDQPCCSPTVKYGCRTCRFLTIMFYLNDVEEGGGTAFPVADNMTLDADKLRKEHLINLREHCHDANLVVSPSKGKAVLWYNHHVNLETKWMGDLDSFSLHGSCPVTRGEKWIANFWVKTSEDRDADIKRMNL